MPSIDNASRCFCSHAAFATLIPMENDVVTDERLLD